MLGPPPLMDFRAPIDGADNASDIGSDFRSDYSFMKLVTNRAQLRTPSTNTGRQGAWETYVGGTGGGRLASDSAAVEVQLALPVGSLAADNATCFGFCAEAPGTAAVWTYFLMTNGNGSAIFTYVQPAAAIPAPGNSSGMSGQTLRGSTVGSIASTSLVRMEQRRYLPGRTRFDVYVNNGGSPFATWDDTTGIVPRGLTRRRWFIQTEGNSPMFNPSAPFYSLAIASARGYDLFK